MKPSKKERMKRDIYTTGKERKSFHYLYQQAIKESPPDFLVPLVSEGQWVYN